MTKKLIAIFAVMTITMFAVIKAFGEVTPIGVDGHLLKCHSSQMNVDVLVPTGSEKDVYLSDQLWDEIAADRGDIPGFKRTETTLKFDWVYEDTSTLLKPSNSFYIVVEGPEYKERSRFWKSRKTGKVYQKRVNWTKKESK